jgi:hypothetical protein
VAAVSRRGDAQREGLSTGGHRIGTRMFAEDVNAVATASPGRRVR